MIPRTSYHAGLAAALLLQALPAFAQPQLGIGIEAPELEAALTIDLSDPRFAGTYCQVPTSRSFCKDIPLLPEFLEPCVRVREARVVIEHIKSTSANGLLVRGLLRASGTVVVKGEQLTFAAAGKVTSRGSATTSGTLSRVGKTTGTLTLSDSGNSFTASAFGATLTMRRCLLAAEGDPSTSVPRPPSNAGVLFTSVLATATESTDLGTFRGRGPGGELIALSLEQRGLEVRATGMMGKQPAVLSALLSWGAGGSLKKTGDPERAVDLELSADGQSLRLAVAGERPIVLSRGEGELQRSYGPFSGLFEARREEAVLVELSIVQSGALLAGGGTAFGQPVGLTGQAGDDGRADVTLVFMDESRVRIELELPQEGRYGELKGLGAPLDLRRSDD